MTEIRGHLGARPIIEVIRQIHLGRLSGQLEIRQGESTRRFVFSDGELFLPSTHALAQRLDELLSPKGDDEDTGPISLHRTSSESEELRTIVGRIVDVLRDWTTGDYEFTPGDMSISDGMIGPLPTSYLIMEGSVRGLSEAELLERLGGESGLIVATRAQRTTGEIGGIEPGEMFLLSRAEQPVAVSELLRQVPGERLEVLRMLCRLQGVDLVLGLDPQKAEAKEESAPPMEPLVERFLVTIGDRLDKHPVLLPIDEHAQRMRDLFSNLGSVNHYELLGVSLHADDGQVYDAYDDLARTAHPEHAERLGMEGREAVFRLVFERATMAYITLSDPERRAEYNKQAGIDGSDLGHDEDRFVERKKLAREHFRRATELVANEDYHFALELVRLAIRNDPQAEYYALLGEIQSHNPQWSEQATESYRQALRRDPENAHYRVALGRLMEKTGQPNRARIHYRAALQNEPADGEAHEALERLSGRSGTSASGEDSGKGLLSRIRDMFQS